MSARRLTVALDARAYEIVIGSGLLAQAAAYIAAAVPAKRAILLSDSAVAAHYERALAEALIADGFSIASIHVPPGEGSKSFGIYQEVMEQLLALNPDRKTALIALGGGVVGDLTGFAASTLLRGVPFVQIPTSLLAQVDSSVGGKTAINAKAGKNLIGSFYQPRLVLADLDVLKTLPPREMKAGYAEVIKYGLIADAEFYRWCLAHGAQVLAGDVAALSTAIEKSCAMKAAIVAEDERETDRRALLNFGHTFAHALEAETGFGERLLHGEAVAIGMVMGCRLSHRMGLIGPELEAELAAHFDALGMPARPSDVPGMAWNAEAIASHFVADKKAEAGTLTFVVLEALGQAAVRKQVDPALALDVVKSYLE